MLVSSNRYAERQNAIVAHRLFFITTPQLAKLVTKHRDEGMRNGESRMVLLGFGRVVTTIPDDLSTRVAMSTLAGTTGRFTEPVRAAGGTRGDRSRDDQ
jgi:hypothetical protein